MRVWVTGAKGFVGRILVEHLNRSGYDVIGSDLALDVTDSEAVNAKLAETQPGAVIHLAAQSSVSVSLDAPDRTFRTNFLGTHNLLEAISRHVPSARVVVVSSSDVYGSVNRAGERFDETAPLVPQNPYSRSKAAADLLGGLYAQRGLDIVRVRPFNHTGTGQSDTFVLPNFARQVAEIQQGRRAPEMEVGNLESVRDFLDVSDVVEPYKRLLDPGAPAGIYNIASGHATSIRSHLDTLFSIAGVSPEIRVRPDRYRPTDHAVGNASKLRLTTGWSPQIDFRDTLSRLYAHWSEQVADD